MPSDANDLVAAVWPPSAGRDDAGVLQVAGVSVAELRERFGTPLYVLDEDEVRARARRVRAAFEDATARHGIQARVYYAGKAFLSTEVVRWVTEEGLAVDVATGGELAVARRERNDLDRGHRREMEDDDAKHHQRGRRPDRISSARGMTAMERQGTE